MVPTKDSLVYIQSYKHDGSLHRCWDKGYVLEADEEKYVIITNKTWVYEANGHSWYTREPAICYFSTKRWFNVIAMIRENGIYYYCNLASPALYDGEAVKYIDYDLDYKIFPDGYIQTMDEDEYQLHSKKMNYPGAIDKIIRKEMEMVLADYRSENMPFNKQRNLSDFTDYLARLGQ